MELEYTPYCASTPGFDRCGQNVDMATRELNNMGYAGRQKATERNIEREFKTGDLEKEKQRKVKEEREQSKR